MSDLKVGDKIRINDLETVVEYFTGVDEDEMVGTPYGEFAIGLVEKLEWGSPIGTLYNQTDVEDALKEAEFTFDPLDNGLTYAEDYHPLDLKHFVNIIPIRELRDNEELHSICQIRDDRTGTWYVGFVIKKWDTASVYTSEWIGSKLVENKNE